MKILVIRETSGCSGSLRIRKRNILAVLVLALLVLPLASLFGGYRIGYKNAETSVLITGGLQEELNNQRMAIEQARRTAEENLIALAARLGQMQAHVTRLDAMGQRITSMAGLEDGEFSFEQPPALGGPENLLVQQSLQVPDFIAMLDNLAIQLENRNNQLGILETMLINRSLQAEVLPAGRPIKGGWISSRFGTRTDPFTGRQAHHNGIDFAGKEGAEVFAVASGVVTWAGSRTGYGNLVEINHGKGYVTRYGHNKSVLVKSGDTIKKGQPVAILGSTGRSTGPHVHFEVLHNGRAVDPARYVQAKK